MTKRDLEHEATDALATTGFDRLVDFTFDIIEAVPVAGPLVVAFGRQVVPRDSAIDLRDFLTEVARRVAALEAAGRVDLDYVRSDEYVEDVHEVVEAMNRSSNRAKRAYFASALSNAATNDRPDDVERHRFLDLLSDIRPSHLRLLAVVITAESAGSIPGGNDEYLTTRLPDQDLENIKLDWSDLQRARVLQAMPTGVASTPVYMRYWHANSAMGKRFAGYIEAVENDPSSD